MPIIAGIIAALVIFIGYPVSCYNGMVSGRNTVAEQAANIDAMLVRRAELIPNLVETVKGYTKHESEVFTAVANARSALLAANTTAGKLAANGELNNALGRLMAISERYPELKADKIYVGLMDELAGSENRISSARTDYNRAVRRYNSDIQGIPGAFLAKFGDFPPAEPFQADAASKAAPKVKF